MKRKEFIFIAVILLLVFAGISIFKHLGHTDGSDTSTEAAKSDSIQTFWAYYNRATEYRLHGNEDSSIIEYQEALKLNPNHEDALYYTGNMYMKVGEFDKAQETWEKLTVLNPQSERTYNQLGNLYFCMNHTDYFHPEKSKWYFKRAADLNKETLNPNLRLGEIALFQDSTNDAFDILNKLSMMDQKNVEIFFMLGYLNWKSGKELDAIKDLGRTYELGLPAISASEEESTTNSGKKILTGKGQKCDLFMDWLFKNLSVPKLYDGKAEMPKVYKKFDQYLLMIRKQLNHD